MLAGIGFELQNLLRSKETAYFETHQTISRAYFTRQMGQLDLLGHDGLGCAAGRHGGEKLILLLLVLLS